MRISCKDKCTQFGVFIGMTYTTQNLDVGWVGAKRRFGAVRLDVMPLQLSICAAFFALAALFNYFCNCFSRYVRTFASATFPIWVCRTFRHSAKLATQNGTVVASTAASFANLKLFATLFANTIKHSFLFARFKFVGARSRTSIGFASHMRVRPSKLNTASATCQRDMSAPFNLSLES